MITSIEIENLRGIRTGKLEGLTPLTILTGPNACGKSTVLDALLISASPIPEEDLGRAVQRHQVVRGGSRWLFGDPGRPADLAIGTRSGAQWRRRLQRHEHCTDRLRDRLEEVRARSPFSMIVVKEGEKYSDDSRDVCVGFSVDNRYVSGITGPGAKPVPIVRLVDPGLPKLLHREFTDAARAGRRDDIYGLLSVLVPDFERLEILVGDDEEPLLHLTCKSGSVPLGLAGDGVQAFVQLALEVAIASDGLALIEEPEVYQHPKAIWQSAKVLLANMRRGVQTVLTTHSLELIDALLAEASADDLEKMSVFNLLLEDGKLSSGRRAGEEIAFARQTLENDLR